MNNQFTIEPYKDDQDEIVQKISTVINRMFKHQIYLVNDDPENGNITYEIRKI